MTHKTRYTVDGHTHFYPSFEEKAFLEAARRKLDLEKGDLPTLLLTETPRNNTFRKWKSGDCIWPVQNLKEDCELLIDGRILVIAGRQVTTAEKIEVLATFVDAEFPEGEDLATTIDRVEHAGGLPILPWGAGKWLGKRGATLANFAQSRTILLGDIMGRPSIWSLPVWARSRRLIPGSDPLFYRSQEQVVGSFGFSIKTDSIIDLDNPSLQLREAMESPSKQIDTLGKHVSLAGCLINQLKLRIHKTNGRRHQGS